MKKLFIWLVVLLLPLTCVAAQEQDDDVLRVDASERLGTINPYVYGANHGPWAPLSMDVVPQLQAVGINFLRFPGGRWGDENDLRPEQIDLFIIQAQMIGAEPSIHVRLEHGTPEAAAELVRYVNIEKEYNVRYWSIGNEPTLFDDYSVDQLNEEWRVIAEAMLTVDPDIILVGPDVHQYATTESPGDPNARMREWVRGFLQVNGDLVDIVAIHRYPFPSSRVELTTIEDLRRDPPRWDNMISILRKDIHDAVGRDMPVAVTEINSHWNNADGGEAGLSSFYNAIWYADVLGRLIHQQVDIVTFFTLATVASGWGLVDRYDPRPTYYVYQIYSQFGTELIEASSTSEDVSIFAALRDDGTLTMIVVNRGPDEITPTLELAGFAPQAPAEVWRFDAEHDVEMIGEDDIGDVNTITIPGQSITLYIVPGEPL